MGSEKFCVCDITFLAAPPPIYATFYNFFVNPLSSFPSDILLNGLQEALSR